MAWLATIGPWHWLVLALVLIGAEALGSGGFLLGAAAAAFLLAALCWLMPELGWAGQFVIFGFAAVIFSVAYWKLFRGYNEQTEQPLLNDRAAQLVGRQLTLEQDLAAGEGRIQIGDTRWRVYCASPLVTGQRVRIERSEGMLLYLSAVE